MSDIYDTYEDWEDEAKDSPLALVGILVMVLTSAAIVGNALFMQPKSAKIEMMNRVVKEADSPQTTGAIQRNKSSNTADAIRNDHASLTLAVQRQLTMAGYYVGPLDGLEGAQTREAIAAYQDANGMKTTGRVNMVLYDVLTGRRSAPQTQPTTIVTKQPKSVPQELVKFASLPKARPRNLKPNAKPVVRQNVTMPAPAARMNVARGPVPPAPIPTANASDPILAKVRRAEKLRLRQADG